MNKKIWKACALLLVFFLIFPSIISLQPASAAQQNSWEEEETSGDYARYKYHVGKEGNVIHARLVTTTDKSASDHDKIIFTLFDQGDNVIAHYSTFKKGVEDLNALHRSTFFLPEKKYIEYIVVELVSRNGSNPELITEVSEIT